MKPGAVMNRIQRPIPFVSLAEQRQRQRIFWQRVNGACFMLLGLLSICGVAYISHPITALPWVSQWVVAFVGVLSGFVMLFGIFVLAESE